MTRVFPSLLSLTVSLATWHLTVHSRSSIFSISDGWFDTFILDDATRRPAQSATNQPNLPIDERDNRGHVSSAGNQRRRAEPSIGASHFGWIGQLFLSCVPIQRDVSRNRRHSQDLDKNEQQRSIHSDTIWPNQLPRLDDYDDGESAACYSCPSFLEDCPDDFLCPITLCLMRDPFITVPSGITYERNALISALKSDPKDPVSRVTVQCAVKNRTLKDCISKWIDQKRQKQQQQSDEGKGEPRYGLYIW